jgi:hypothetical protein
VRTLIAIIMVSLMATSTGFALKASHHHSKRAAPKHQSATKTDPGGIARHPDDVALDRKIRSNGAERHLEQLRMTVVWCDRHKEAVIPLGLQH